MAVGVAATGAGLLLPGADLSDAATVGVRVGAVALAVIGLVVLTSRWGGAARVPGDTLGWVLLTAGLLMAGVTALTFGFSDAVISEPDTLPTPPTSVEPTTTTIERPTTTPAQRDLDNDGDLPVDDLLRILGYLVVLGVLALVVYAVVRVLGVAGTTRWWRSEPPVPVDADADRIDVAAAEAGLEASLDAVTADRSPRDAISDAYARLLAALADAGAGRRSHEAPHEHLDRVLTPLGVRSEPLHRLAELFVLARFSQHPVTAAHRDDAGDALRQALADLRAAQERREQAKAERTAAP